MTTRIATTAASRGRLAITTIFFVNAFTFATWVANIPLVKARLGLSESVLGLSLLSIAIGGLIAMPLAGVLISHFGSKRVTTATISVTALLPVLPLNADRLDLLVLSLFLLGAFQSASAVSMNAQAVVVEDAIGRPVMSSFHGFWSVGSLAGAGLGILLISSGITPLVHAAIVSTVAVSLIVLAVPYLLATDAEQLGQRFALPTGPLLLLGMLAFFALMSEGAIADWSAIYLRDVLGAPEGFAVAGFAAFSLTMALGRFVGDRLHKRSGVVTLLRSSALLSSFGLGLALVPNLLAALVGFGLMGFGMANLIPLLYGAAGRTTGVDTGVGIAAVTTAGYLGYLVGPPFIGFAAEVIGLSGALFTFVIATGLVALFANKVK